MTGTISLTPLQQAYWAGRREMLDLGGVAIHFYYEIDSTGIDLERLETAWNRVISRHPMLNAVVTADGQLRVEREVQSYRIRVTDLSQLDEDLKTAELASIRETISHRNDPGDCWPHYLIQATRINEDHYHIHLSFDGLFTDFRSHYQILEEWGLLYEDPAQELPAPEADFSDFISELRKPKRREEESKEVWKFWEDLMAEPLPPPTLPGNNEADGRTGGFTRNSISLKSAEWERLKAKASESGLSASHFILAVYLDALGIYSKNQDFTLNVSILDAIAREPKFRNVVGAFGSTTFMPVRGADGRTFTERALRRQKILKDSLNHCVLSGIEVLREMTKRTPGRIPTILPVVYTGLLGLNKQFEYRMPTHWLGECVFSITQTPQVTLDLQAHEREGHLVMDFDYREGVFMEGFMDDFTETQAKLLHRLAQSDEAWDEPLPSIVQSVLPDRQLRRITEANDVSAAIPESLLQDGFLRQARENPEAIAVIEGSKSFTYADVLDLATRVASWLQNQETPPDQPVAIVMKKGWEETVAALGVVLSGAPYVPIDAGFPLERIRTILEKTGAERVLSQAPISLDGVCHVHLTTLVITEDLLRRSPAMELAAQTTPESLAYIIFTSGSTGRPKGVMIEHKAAMNTILAVNERLQVGSSDRIMAFSSLGFDLSVYDIFGILSAGGTVIIPDPALLRDPGFLLRLVREQEITLWNSVPAIVQLLVDYAEAGGEPFPLSLRAIMMSGDWIPVNLRDRIRELAKDSRVICMGGATEASIWSIAYEEDYIRPDLKTIPYGKPLPNQTWCVLDHQLAPRPVGVQGELCIGGRGLARGYWDEPVLTQERFIQNPTTGERLFRTGDIGRLLPDGNFEILGREDFQVKINGYRVELTEIESVLDRHPAVRIGIVLAEGPKTGNKRLVAFVVSENNHPWMPEELRDHLSRHLPSYMLPHQLIRLEKLPLTPNGKVDRSALEIPPPEPSSDRTDPGEMDNLEETVMNSLRQIIGDVMGSTPTNERENLLSLGATSIDLIRILNTVERNFGFHPSMRDFFDSPDLATLAGIFIRGVEATPNEQSGRTAVNDDIITDPEEREAFKEKQVALYKYDARYDKIPLPMQTPQEDLEARFSRRKSSRTFATGTLSMDQMAGLMENLVQLRLKGSPKRLYGSAGGLYPIQSYLFFKDKRISDITGGAYYFDPDRFRFVRLSDGENVTGQLYDPLVNEPIFNRAAFAIFLIADMAAIEPLYGDQSFRYAAIEAGLISQILELAAPDHGIGLCQVGELGFDAIRPDFLMTNNHRFVHSLLGGPASGFSPG
jgi:pyochelin synthetase